MDPHASISPLQGLKETNLRSSERVTRGAPSEKTHRSQRDGSTGTSEGNAACRGGGPGIPSSRLGSRLLAQTLNVSERKVLSRESEALYSRSKRARPGGVQRLRDSAGCAGGIFGGSFISRKRPRWEQGLIGWELGFLTLFRKIEEQGNRYRAQS